MYKAGSVAHEPHASENTPLAHETPAAAATADIAAAVVGHGAPALHSTPGPQAAHTASHDWLGTPRTHPLGMDDAEGVAEGDAERVMLMEGVAAGVAEGVLVAGGVAEGVMVADGVADGAVILRTQ